MSGSIIQALLVIFTELAIFPSEWMRQCRPAEGQEDRGRLHLDLELCYSYEMRQNDNIYTLANGTRS